MKPQLGKVREDYPTGWPVSLVRSLEDIGTGPATIETLGGMSGASVYRARFTTTSVIVKVPVRPAETAFYRTIAPRAKAAGISLPAVYGGGDTADPWLILEDIPIPFPQERWLADPEVLAMLARLHAMDVETLPPIAGAYRPAWPAASTEQALSLLPSNLHATLRPHLERLRDRAQPLFRPLCPISADPSPLNWGLRSNGDLVLFDWERFTLGMPALDLAITVPGLGNTSAYTAVARAYLDIRPDPETTAERLARDIAVAKVWSVVEFMCSGAEGRIVVPSPLDWLAGAVPDWFLSVDPVAAADGAPQSDPDGL